MLILLRSFHLLASFLLIRSCSTVSLTIERNCSTDNDCDHQLICDTKTNVCVCSKPYFWSEDIQTCLGCAPGWLDFETNKCLLYAISRSPGVTRYQAELMCNDLLAQSMFINSTEEYHDLQQKIEDLLNGNTALAATLYFHQGAWIDINNEWIESYTWCNNDKKRDGIDCLQIRQNSLTNTICLQYIPCLETAQFICEAKPVTRLVLEKNLGESHKNDETIHRYLRQVRPKPSPVFTTRKMMYQLMTTKKPSSWNADHITSLATTGMETIGVVANAVGSIFGRTPTQPPSAPQQDLSAYTYNQDLMPQALAGTSEEKPNNLLIYAAIGGGLLLVVILICVISYFACSRKKTTRESSIRSTESEASEGFDE